MPSAAPVKSSRPWQSGQLVAPGLGREIVTMARMIACQSKIGTPRISANTNAARKTSRMPTTMGRPCQMEMAKPWRRAS